MPKLKLGWSLTVEAILGLDILSTHGAKIDLQQSRLHLEKIPHALDNCPND